MPLLRFLNGQKHQKVFRSKLADSFGYEKLEERAVLNADFGFAGGSLQLNNFVDSSPSTELVSISQTGSTFEFVISDGVWIGNDAAAGISGAGSNTLSIDSSVANLADIFLDNNSNDQFDIEFGDFNFIGDVEVGQLSGTSQFGTVSQALGTSLSIDGSLDISGVTTINLGEATNDFDVVSVSRAESVLLADSDSITLADVEATVGAVNVMADGDILIGEVDSAQTIDITSTGGSINDLQDDSFVDLTAAGAITLEATDEIGGNVPAGTANDVDARLEFAAGSVVDAVSNSGDIALRGLGDITLEDVQATVGAIDVMADGDVLVGRVEAGTTIDIMAGDSINDLEDDEVADFIAGDTVTLTTTDEIGGSVPAGSVNDANQKLEFADGSDVDAVSDSGDIELRGLGDLTLDNIETTDGSIDIMAENDIIVGSVIAGTTIDLMSTMGSINDSAIDDVLDLDAGGVITLDANVDIGGAPNGKLELAGDSTVVATADTGDIALAGLADTSTTGLSLQDTQATAGAVDVMADGNITVGSVMAGTTIDLMSTMGSINDSAIDDVLDLDAGGVITLDANVDIGGLPNGKLELAGDSTVVATADTGDIALAGGGGLTLDNIETTDGSIDIMADGNISATNVVANQGSVSLMSGGDVSLGLVAADDILSPNVAISVQAAGDILDGDGAVDDVDIQAGQGRVVLEAGGDIGNAGEFFKVAREDINGIETVTSELDATAGGSIVINEIGSTNTALSLSASTAFVTSDADLVFVDDMPTVTNLAILADGTLTLPDTLTVTGDLRIEGLDDVIAADGSINLEANSLLFVSGMGETIFTEVNYLDVIVDGNLDVTNVGDLTLVDLNCDHIAAHTLTASGMISIVANSNPDLSAIGNDGLVGDEGTLIVSDDVIAGPVNDNDSMGSITLSSDDAININDVVLADNGNITILAAENVNFASTGIVTTSDGNIDISSSGGDIVMANQSLVIAGRDITDNYDPVAKSEIELGGETNGGTISLDASQNITLSSLQTTNNTSDAVRINSTAGAVIDGGDADTDIIANAVTTITSGTGIGATGASGKLEFADGSVVDAESTTGDIALRGLGEITLEDVEATVGAVDVMADGDVLVGEVEAGTTIDVLTTGGSINDLASDGLVDLDAGGLIRLDAAGDIGGMPNGNLELAGGSVVVATATTGNIALNGLASLPATPGLTGLTIPNVTTNGGTISLDAIDDIIVTSLDTTNDTEDAVRITSTNDLFIDSIFATGDVSLTAGNDVISFLFNDDRAIVAQTLSINAGNQSVDGVNDGVRLDTNVDTLNVEIGGTGDLSINEQNDITLNSVSTGGNVFITADGDIISESVQVVSTDPDNSVSFSSSSSIEVGSLQASSSSVFLAAMDDVFTSNPELHLISDRLTVRAENSLSGGVFDGINLATNVNTLDLVLSPSPQNNTGSVSISEANALDVEFALNFQGSVSIDSGANLVAKQVFSRGADIDDAITLTALGIGSDVVTGRIATFQRLGGVVINADDDIRHLTNVSDSENLIRAKSLELSSSNNQQDLLFNGILLTNNNVIALNATVVGQEEAEIRITNEGPLSSDILSVETGSINLTNRNGNLNVNSARIEQPNSLGSIFLQTEGSDSDLRVGDIFARGSRGIFLSSNDDIFDSSFIDDAFLDAEFIGATSENQSEDVLDGIFLSALFDDISIVLLNGGGQFIADQAP